MLLLVADAFFVAGAVIGLAVGYGMAEMELFVGSLRATGIAPTWIWCPRVRFLRY